MEPHRARDTGARPVPAARPRYPRITLAAVAGLVTLVAVLGGVGLLPTAGTTGPAYAAPALEQTRAGTSEPRDALALSGSVTTSLPRLPEEGTARAAQAGTAQAASTALPEKSGQGRRVVFSITDQRVWLVSGNEKVRRSYLVSGSVTDNLQPGTYEVYSRSLHAIGVDDSGTMRYMVRFAHGEHAAIGFHDIPVDDGHRLQTVAELGTPQSHGCIRQRRVDARALWDFAPVGTQVVVLA